MTKARLSSRGQVALPKEVRERLGLEEGDSLTVMVDGDAVVLRKAAEGSWRAWDSRLKGSALLADLAKERRKELLRDSNRT